jgi:hypothetical protein
MDEDVFNMSIRKFLKKVGVTGQREIETAVREALAAGRLGGGESLPIRVTLSLPAAGLEQVIEGEIELA